VSTVSDGHPPDDEDREPLVPETNILSADGEYPRGDSVGEVVRPCDNCEEGIYQSAGHELVCGSCGMIDCDHDSVSTARRAVSALRERRERLRERPDRERYRSGRVRLAGGHERAYPDERTTRDDTPIVSGEPLSL